MALGVNVVEVEVERFCLPADYTGGSEAEVEVHFSVHAALLSFSIQFLFLPFHLSNQ